MYGSCGILSGGSEDGGDDDDDDDDNDDDDDVYGYGDSKHLLSAAFHPCVCQNSRWVKQQNMSKTPFPILPFFLTFLHYKKRKWRIARDY